jgi:hypothetical protein
MANITVSVTDANNITVQLTPVAAQNVTIDRGVAGNGITSIVPVTISSLQYLRIYYTNGTQQDVGPITSTAYTGTSPIDITGNTISLLTVPISKGGTNAVTAAAAIQNLLPSYTGNASKRLGLNSGATALEWVADGGGTVTSVDVSGGTTGLTTSGGPITGSGTITLTGTLAIANGGTNGTATPTAGAVPYGSGTAYAFTAAGTAGQILQSNGALAPTWANLSSLGVSSFSAGTTGFTPSTATSGAVSLAGTLNAANGGTGQSSYAVGDLLYASTTTALSKLADVATGNALISGGVLTAPSWGKIGLTTHVSGTLATTNGGTGLTSFTSGGVVYASSTSALATGSALVFDGTNLGIGVTSMSYPLDVKLANNQFILARESTANITNGFRIGGSSNESKAVFSANSATGEVNLGAINTNYYLTFSTNGANIRALIDASGNMGIGETSPSTFGKLVVKDGTINLVTDTATSRRLSFWSTANGNSENAYIQAQNDGGTTNTGQITFATRPPGGSLTTRATLEATGRLVATYGSYADPSLASSGSTGLQIYSSATYNDNSGHTIAGVGNTMCVIHIRQGGVTSIPVYSNGGAGVAYQVVALNPQTGTWTAGSTFTITVVEATLSGNTYTITFNGGSGTATITRTAGSNTYGVYLQYYTFA